MSQIPARTALHPRPTLACLGTGLLMGQMVQGISAFHNGSIVGLTLALVFVLSGGASLALFLNHRHVERRPRTEPAPIQAWLLVLGAAMIASMTVGRVI